MKEDFLHYIWKHQFFNSSELCTVGGEKVEILKVGDYNTNAGPDFLNATLKINNLVWVGNIEIHINSSDWDLHNHQNDKNYNTVILHLVYDNNKLILNENFKGIPTIELKNRIDLKVLNRYIDLFSTSEKVLCAKYLSSIKEMRWDTTLVEMLLERLVQKSTFIAQQITFKKYDLEWVIFSLIAQALGLKVNKDTMFMLAQSLPYKIIQKHQTNTFQLGALLFGQAGFLNDNFTEEYPNSLKREYQYLQKKYKLKPIDKHIWKFLRLRPASFPTIRIAQLQSILSQPHFYAKVKHAKTYDKLKKLLKVSMHPYWETHYNFKKSSVKRKKNLGSATIDVIMINAIVPMYYHLGSSIPVYKTYAIKLLSKIKPEKNSIVKRFVLLGSNINSAADTQAIIQLYNYYCTPKKCLTCSIGNQLMKDV